MSKIFSTEIDYFEDYQMIAIVSHLKDYTLCHHININLNFDLIKFDDLIINSKANTESHFSWYYYKDKISSTNYYLIGNKCENGYLLRSQKKADYFLLIKNPVSNELLKPMANSLRKVSKVTAVFQLHMQSEKKMDALLESIELHELEVICTPHD